MEGMVDLQLPNNSPLSVASAPIARWVLGLVFGTLMITTAQHNQVSAVAVDPPLFIPDGSRAPPLITTAPPNTIDEAPTVLITPASPGHQQLISAAAPCDTDTGGTCPSFPYICDASRNAICEWGVCVCGSGQCVANGACVAPTAAPTLGPGDTAAPSTAPTAAPTTLPNTYCNWEPASLFSPAINCSISNLQCR